MNDWPIDPPTCANPGLRNVPSPMLPSHGGAPGHRRDFAARAFELFTAQLLVLIGDVNEALAKYHKEGGSTDAYEDYKKAAQKYRDFIRRPTVKTGLDPTKDPLPARVFGIEGLTVETRVEGDYCVAVNISGAVVFSAGGPVGESSSSSSSHPTLPPKWP